jgi:acetoin utilization deacetylase AcuC-like enzyme
MTFQPGLSLPALPTTVVWDAAMTAYNFGPGHPMAPERLDLTARLASSLGLLDLAHVTLSAPDVADDGELTTVHSPDFVAAVRQASDNPAAADESYGLGTEDDPAFAGMHEAAARLAGGSLLAASSILDGSAVRAVNFGGGLHHASRDRASGFCVYNDAALAVRKLLDGGVQRVAYIDVDAHHGDGTQSIFWDDPRVLTISLHETGMSLFPGTGFANEIGGPEALGSAVNVALPAGTGDAGWLRAFHAVVPQLVGAFAPEVIVSQHGCDSHRLDPLTHSERERGRTARGRHRRREPGRPALRKPLDRHRRRRIPHHGRRAADVEPPDRHRSEPAGAAADPRAGGVADVRAGALRRGRAGEHGRRRRRLVALVGGGLRPQRRHRPHRDGHAQGSLPAARPGPLVRLVPRSDRSRAYFRQSLHGARPRDEIVDAIRRICR